MELLLAFWIAVALVLMLALLITQAIMRRWHALGVVSAASSVSIGLIVLFSFYLKEKAVFAVELIVAGLVGGISLLYSRRFVLLFLFALPLLWTPIGFYLISDPSVPTTSVLFPIMMASVFILSSAPLFVALAALFFFGAFMENPKPRALDAV